MVLRGMNLPLPLIIACVIIVLGLIIFPLIISYKAEKKEKLSEWEKIKEKAVKSIAPSLVYEEGDVIKRAIRDVFEESAPRVVGSDRGGRALGMSGEWEEVSD